MKVIVDNGGSTLDWLILGENTIYSNRSINVFDSDDNIISSIKTIFSSLFSSSEKIEIDFYTTGLTDFSKQRIKKLFLKCLNINSINIFSDMLAASRALFNNSQGIACILGTGSNCAYFDGQVNHEITFSTGYLLGDQGSGYELGNLFLRHYFKKNIPIEISDIFEKTTNLNRLELISSIYNSENPKFYIASFSKFVKQYEKHPFFTKMIIDSFSNFLKDNPFKYTNFQSLQFGFVGSVAFNFKNYIGLLMDEKKIQYAVLEKPIKNIIHYYL